MDKMSPAPYISRITPALPSGRCVPLPAKFPSTKPLMSLLSSSFRSLRSALPAALTALSLAAGVQLSPAQTTIQAAHPIGLEHAQSQPYNFTGRIFNLGTNVEIASGTLIRRHTVLTAGHVVYDPTAGFITNGTFTRGLYETASVSKDQIISAQALSGYQALSTAANGVFTITAAQVDLGIVLVNQAPIDNNWANYVATPTLLADSSVATFVLGYPGDSFDGRTMTFIVPSTPFVAVASTAGGALYENDEVSFEHGNSGGPIYVVPDGVNRYVAAEVSSGIDDTTGTFNASFIRAIDKSAAKFIADAEYTAGLISQVKVVGPKTVVRGRTYTYTANVIFSQPLRGTSTGGVTTDRYAELKLKSNTPGTKTAPQVTVVKTSNTTFAVTFNATNLRANTTTTLQVYYDKTAMPSGKSSRLVKIQ